MGHNVQASSCDSGIPVLLQGKSLLQYSVPSRANVPSRALLGDNSDTLDVPEVPPVMPTYVMVAGIVVLSLILFAIMLCFVCSGHAATAHEESTDYYDHIHAKMQRTRALQNHAKVRAAVTIQRWHRQQSIR